MLIAKIQKKNFFRAPPSSRAGFGHGLSAFQTEPRPKTGLRTDDVLSIAIDISSRRWIMIESVLNSD